MDTLIRVAEVWVPNADGTLLELAGGRFDATPGFGAASRGMCFGRGEGLPGRAWDCGHPILLPTFEGSYFRRVAAARAAGLDSGVALPVFAGDVLTSVVVLLCAAGPKRRGAIELWRNDPRVTGDLRLDDGLFGDEAAALAEEARDGYLPRGAGLPGLAWQREAAVFAEDVGASRHFLRVQTAAAAGLVRGLAIPCSVRGSATWVANLLAAPQAPVARRVEGWLLADGGLQRGFGFCERRGRLPAASLALDAEPALPGLAYCARSATAQALEDLSANPEAPLADAWADGLRTLIALPVIVDGALSEVVALYF